MSRRSVRSIFHPATDETVLSLVDNESGGEPTRGGVSARSGRKPARATRHFSKERLRMHVYLHLPVFQMTIGHHGKHGSRRLHFLLHDVRRPLGLPDGALPRRLVQLRAGEAVLIAIIIVRLQHKLLTVLVNELP